MRRPAYLAAAIDHTVVPFFLVTSLLGTWALFRAGLPDQLVVGLVVGFVAACAVVLERLHPERPEYVPLDQPLLVEVLHFFLNYQLGYALGFGACLALANVARVDVWPSGWPMALQVLLAALLSEALSYWQHRLFHTVPRLWRFHRLHHSGGRLNVLRTARFHAIDLAAGAFLTFLPLVMLGASPIVVGWVGSLAGTVGVLSHANIRMRTPAWASRVFCTPAIHRHHHSLDAHEGSTNYGTLVTLWDALFGTYERPREAGPVAVGVIDDPTPRGFVAQTLDPFRRPR
jgi:ornithine lipid hydroxylase